MTKTIEEDTNYDPHNEGKSELELTENKMVNKINYHSALWTRARTNYGSAKSLRESEEPPAPS